MRSSSRLRSVRSPAALLVAVIAAEALAHSLTGDSRGWPSTGGAPPLSGWLEPATCAISVALLALLPRLWRGTRAAVTVAAAGLLALAAIEAGQGRYAHAAAQAAAALALGLARGAFGLGCPHRPRRAMLATTAGSWALVAAAVLCAPLVGRTAGHVLSHVLHHAAAAAHRHAAAPAGGGHWNLLVDVLVAAAAAASLVTLRSLTSPARAANSHSADEDHLARAIVAAHGTDTLSPFLVRPDKALAFAAGGVLSYRVIRETAVVSADPVAPPGAAPAVLSAFLRDAHQHGWQVALWGASERHLQAYRALGLRALCVGEEAFVDPSSFTLDGRAVRKLRQSVHRVHRRGWEIAACEGRRVDGALEAEIDALAARWRRAHPRVHGFAMGMGPFDSEVRADDLYVLARSPDGDLGAVMRFVLCGDTLSLDTMQRVGDTPNGLNEALVVRALEAARERGVAEVSLNYAGLAHLVRGEHTSGRRLARLALGPLHRRFQMDRLVRFNEKFSPQWRPRYLVYESRAALPRAILRVLQAEGYLPEPSRRSLRRVLPDVLPRTVPDRIRPRGPISDTR